MRNPSSQEPFGMGHADPWTADPLEEGLRVLDGPPMPLSMPFPVRPEPMPRRPQLRRPQCGWLYHPAAVAAIITIASIVIFLVAIRG